MNEVVGFKNKESARRAMRVLGRLEEQAARPDADRVLAEQVDIIEATGDTDAGLGVPGKLMMWSNDTYEIVEAGTDIRILESFIGRFAGYDEGGTPIYIQADIPVANYTHATDGVEDAWRGGRLNVGSQSLKGVKIFRDGLVFQNETNVAGTAAGAFGALVVDSQYAMAVVGSTRAGGEGSGRDGGFLRVQAGGGPAEFEVSTTNPSGSGAGAVRISRAFVTSGVGDSSGPSIGVNWHDATGDVGFLSYGIWSQPNSPDTGYRADVVSSSDRAPLLMSNADFVLGPGHFGESLGEWEDIVTGTNRFNASRRFGVWRGIGDPPGLGVYVGSVPTPRNEGIWEGADDKVPYFYNFIAHYRPDGNLSHLQPVYRYAHYKGGLYCGYTSEDVPVSPPPPPPPPPEGRGGIRVNAWFDENKDAVRQTYEAPVASRSVAVSGPESVSLSTGLDGFVTFSDLSPGVYSVTILTYPPSYEVCDVNGGSVTVVADEIVDVDRPIYIDPPPSPPAGAIVVVIRRQTGPAAFEQINRDVDYAGADTGSGTGNNFYFFTGLPPGDYTVSVTPDGGDVGDWLWQVNSSSGSDVGTETDEFELVDGGTVTVTFTLPLPPPPTTYSISGFVTGAAPNTVYADNGVDPPYSAVTSAGSYSITGLPAGTYTVTCPPVGSQTMSIPADYTGVTVGPDATGKDFTMM